MKPDFIIGGIMKSGTTYLDGILRKHPEIYMLERSMEYSFFDNDNVYRNGIGWYESLYKNFNIKKGEILGQTSADIAFNPHYIERLKKHYPNVKLIFVLRHPVDRSYSLYWHQIKMGREYLSFEKAIEMENLRIAKNYYNRKMFSYLERSRYKGQFDHVFKHIDEQQILLIPFELLIKNDATILDAVFRFLNVTPISDFRMLGLNKMPRNDAMIPSSRVVSLISFGLQRIGFRRIGKIFLSLFLVNRKPPKMSNSTRVKLETHLSKDIEFYNSILDKWSR